MKNFAKTKLFWLSTAAYWVLSVAYDIWAANSPEAMIAYLAADVLLYAWIMRSVYKAYQKKIA